MKLFEIVQQHCALLGISSTNQTTQKCQFNERVLLGFLLFGCIFASYFVYIFRVANGFLDYMVGICTLSGHILIFVCFVTIISKKVLMFESIDRIEKLIDTSEPISNFVVFMIFKMNII